MSHSYKHHLIGKDHGLGRGYKQIANRAYRHKMNQGLLDEFGGKSNNYRMFWNSYDIHDYIWRYTGKNTTDLHNKDLRMVKVK